MPSYSNRHQYQEPMQYGGSQGDFEAGSYNQNYPQYGEVPPPPQLSDRHRSRHGGHLPAQTGPFRPVSGSQFPPPAPTYRPVPPAPHSLAPVAMPAGTARVTHITQDGIEAPARPSAKAGMSILFAGAIIGGLIGAVMHARQNAADAFAAASQQNTHEVTADNGAPPPPAPGGTVIAPDNSKPGDKTAADKTDGSKPDDTKPAKPGKAHVAFVRSNKGPATTKNASSGAVVASGDDDDDVPVKTTATPAKGGKTTTTAKAADKDDDGYTIASADGKGGGGDDAPVKTKTTDVTPKTTAKPAAAAKPDPKPAPAADPPPKTTKPAGKGGDDAVNVLKAAMGATENSL